jgi:hypothetical protein
MCCLVLRRWSVAFLVAIACGTAASLDAAVVWDEAIDGDLNNAGAAPTSLSLAFGSNLLSATSVGGTSIDREYVSFSMPPGSRLGAVRLAAYTGVDQLAFIGVQSGSTFTAPPTGTNPATLLGYTHFGPGSLGVGANYLPAIGTGAGSMGFVPPLAGGNYTFWIQQTSSSSPSTYTFDFVVTPEPNTLILGGLTAGLGFFAGRRRRIV